MPEQMTLTFSEHLNPAAEREAVSICREFNRDTGRPCSYRLWVVPELLRQGLVKEADHNDISAIERDLEARYGVSFTTRKSRHDAGTGPR